MPVRWKAAAVLVPLLFAVAACSLPRGAALESEVVKESRNTEPTFQVVPVSRNNMKAVSRWPATGGYRSFNWLGASQVADASVIASGDLIDLTIFDSQDNSLLTAPTEKSTQMTGLQVDTSGSIFVPYIDRVRIAGLTPASARTRIQRQLEPIVPSAQVLLSMTAGQNNSVDLAGGVGAPGTYPMPSRNYSIMSLISTGGGISSTYENPVVKLIRGGTTYEIFAKDLFRSGGANTLLRPRDVVIVEEDDRTFTAMGASGREDLITFPKPRVSALEALSLMRGLLDTRADPEGVLVLREYAPQALRADYSGPNRTEVIFAFDLTSADGLFAAKQFNIHPDDTVLATESPVVRAQAIFGLFGSALGLTAQTTNVATQVSN